PPVPGPASDPVEAESFVDPGRARVVHVDVEHRRCLAVGPPPAQRLRHHGGAEAGAPGRRHDADLNDPRVALLAADHKADVLYAAVLDAADLDAAVLDAPRGQQRPLWIEAVADPVDPLVLRPVGDRRAVAEG